jgi:hypothetical protein
LAKSLRKSFIIGITPAKWCRCYVVDQDIRECWSPCPHGVFPHRTLVGPTRREEKNCQPEIIGKQSGQQTIRFADGTDGSTRMNAALQAI